ncbi:hypothetical protein EV424DRAFT_1084922 [Suillus variegatus]|nr:hypothetical protein EV424DRAFT_1084922 [Suillus variegatus]
MVANALIINIKHLDAQTQLLPTLHVQLNLLQTTLGDELQTLQHTLTNVEFNIVIAPPCRHYTLSFSSFVFDIPDSIL